MIRVLSYILFLFFTAGLPSAVIAQSPTDYVQGMFSDAESVKWIRSLSGKINDVHRVDLVLGYDGRIYRGRIDYQGIGQVFELVGQAHHGSVVMQEIDGNGHVTGKISGVLEDDRFTGQWWSTDSGRNADLRLLDDGLVFLEKFEPGLVLLEGEAGGQDFDCMLSVESPYVISGSWQRSNECVRVMGECEDFLCKSIEVTVLEGESVNAEIILNKRNGNYSLKIMGEGAPLNGTAQLTQTYPIKHHGLCGFSYMVDYSYPVIKDGGFDLWLASRFEQWFEKSAVEVTNNDGSSAERRWIISASGWVDLFLFEDELISGMITMYDVERGVYRREPFIYSTAEASIIDLKKLGKSGVDLLATLQDNISFEGYASGDFKYPALSESGFIVCTDFDPVYGDASVCVPYDVMANSIRKKTLLTKLED